MAKTSARVVKRAPKAAKKASSAGAPGSDGRGDRRGDWRREKLARVRALIAEADPEAVEEAKWKKASNPAGVPTWSHDGIICTGETYKDKVKLTFARGAALPDPARLFNASLDGGTRRAIDFHEGEAINEKALKALVRAAVTLNTAMKPPPRKKTKRPSS